jgi:hypothetical protein
MEGKTYNNNPDYFCISFLFLILLYGVSCYCFLSEFFISGCILDANADKLPIKVLNNQKERLQELAAEEQGPPKRKLLASNIVVDIIDYSRN